jgi:hypothetical protein
MWALGAVGYAVAANSSDGFSIAQIFRTHDAQSLPAPVVSRIWRADRAPAAMQSCTSLSVTAWQMQTYMAGDGPFAQAGTVATGGQVPRDFHGTKVRHT